jgi:hypothetical protein
LTREAANTAVELEPFGRLTRRDAAALDRDTADVLRFLGTA